MRELGSTLKLNNHEQQILTARLTGLSFSQLGSNDLRIATDQIIIRGAAISGSAMPQTEGFAEILSDEILKFITDFGFGNLTLAEVLLAMRLNCQRKLRYSSGDYIPTVEFSGVVFNVQYLAKILNNYEAARRSFDGRFQNLIDGY